ncbi:MAG TPA: glycosyltransferase family 4 protein [Nitrososphaerales archaeon]|nr:glycosyltransferase family 4 protein [Nitrososphaerales archaeon]
MKIAQVNVYFTPFQVGGAEWYVHNISREFVRRGHEVHVFTANNYGGVTAPESETIDGITVHRLPLSINWSYRMKAWKGLYKALMDQDFDVIHTYDYAQAHSADAVKAGLKTKTPTVLTVFDIHSMIPRVWYKRLPMKIMEGYMARKTVRDASMVLVRAPNLVEPMVQLGGEPDRIRVTSSGVRDESLGEFDGQSFRSRFGISGSPVILYVGRLNPLKGPQFILESAPRILEMFPGAEFVFVGPDQSGYLDTLKDKANRLGVTSSVHFVGPIYDFEQKMQAYASCDVFVLPTSYEGTSQSIFEAMAQGKPVVSTSVGGVPYQLTDGIEGRLVPHSNVDALTSAILEILQDNELASEMGSRGKKRAESQKYSILSSELEGIYKEADAPN